MVNTLFVNIRYRGKQSKYRYPHKNKRMFFFFNIHLHNKPANNQYDDNANKDRIRENMTLQLMLSNEISC